jgi:hypothetical protein
MIIVLIVLQLKLHSVWHRSCNVSAYDGLVSHYLLSAVQGCWLLSMVQPWRQTMRVSSTDGRPHVFA